MRLPLCKAEQCRDNKSSWLTDSVRIVRKITRAVQLFPSTFLSLPPFPILASRHGPTVAE